MRLWIRKFSLIIISTVLVTGASAQHPRLVWMQSLGGSGDQYGVGLAASTDGSLRVAGNFFEEAFLDQMSFESFGERDVFVARLTPGGQLTWIRLFRSVADDFVSGIATDATGHTFIAVNAGDSIAVGPEKLGKGIVLVSLDHDGDIHWSHRIEEIRETGFSALLGLTSTPDGNVYITGAVSDELSFGPFTLKSKGGHSLGWDLFVAAYDAGGVPQWGKLAGSAITDDFGESIAADSAGNSYILGYSSDAFDDIDAPCRPSPSGRDPAVVVGKSNPQGDSEWTVCITDLEDLSKVTNIAVDTDGNVYVLGSFNGTVVSSGARLLDDMEDRAILVKFGPDGRQLWTVKGEGEGRSGAVDLAGNLHLIRAHSQQGTFLEGYDSDGDSLYSLPIGISVAASRGDALIATDDGGHLYLIGTLFGTVELDGATLSSEGGADVFVAKFDLGTGSVSNEQVDDVPKSLAIESIYPTPASTYADIHFTLPVHSTVDVRIYDLFGREISTAYRGQKAAGDHTLHIDTEDLPSGVYFVQLQTRMSRIARMMLIVR